MSTALDPMIQHLAIMDNRHDFLKKRCGEVDEYYRYEPLNSLYRNFRNYIATKINLFAVPNSLLSVIDKPAELIQVKENMVEVTKTKTNQGVKKKYKTTIWENEDNGNAIPFEGGWEKDFMNEAYTILKPPGIIKGTKKTYGLGSTNVNRNFFYTKMMEDYGIGDGKTHQKYYTCHDAVLSAKYFNFGKIDNGTGDKNHWVLKIPQNQWDGAGVLKSKSWGGHFFEYLPFNNDAKTWKFESNILTQTNNLTFQFKYGNTGCLASIISKLICRMTKPIHFEIINPPQLEPVVKVKFHGLGIIIMNKLRLNMSASVASGFALSKANSELKKVDESLIESGASVPSLCSLLEENGEQYNKTDMGVKPKSCTEGTLCSNLWNALNNLKTKAGHNVTYPTLTKSNPVNSNNTNFYDILLDIKRSGDWEQVLGCKSFIKKELKRSGRPVNLPTTCIFFTGDFLCFLYAMIQDINCIYLGTTDMELYVSSEHEFRPTWYQALPTSSGGGHIPKQLQTMNSPIIQKGGAKMVDGASKNETTLKLYTNLGSSNEWKGKFDTDVDKADTNPLGNFKIDLMNICILYETLITYSTNINVDFHHSIIKQSLFYPLISNTYYQNNDTFNFATNTGFDNLITFFGICKEALNSSMMNNANGDNSLNGKFNLSKDTSNLIGFIGKTLKGVDTTVREELLAGSQKFYTNKKFRENGCGILLLIKDLLIQFKDKLDFIYDTCVNSKIELTDNEKNIILNIKSIFNIIYSELSTGYNNTLIVHTDCKILPIPEDVKRETSAYSLLSAKTYDFMVDIDKLSSDFMGLLENIREITMYWWYETNYDEDGIKIDNTIGNKRELGDDSNTGESSRKLRKKVTIQAWGENMKGGKKKKRKRKKHKYTRSNLLKIKRKKKSKKMRRRRKHYYSKAKKNKTTK